MKKPALLLLFIFLWSIGARAQQVPRKVVAEHFTNTYCSICASRNPALYTTLQQYPGVLYVSYHPSSPYAACPLNQHNKPENDARTYYYNVFGGTPQLVVQGRVNNAVYTDTTIFSSRLGKTSSFLVNVSLRYEADDSLTVRTSIRKTDTSSLTALKVYGLLAEDTLFFTAQNGEGLHRNVFRKSCWGNDPVAITAPASVNDSVVLTARLKRNVSWQLNRIYAMIIVQDADTQVVQAGISGRAQAPSAVNNSPVLCETVSLYPNPATDFVMIRTLKPGWLHITDITGRTLYHKPYTDAEVRVETASWPAGTYLVRAAAAAGMFTRQ